MENEMKVPFTKLRLKKAWSEDGFILTTQFLTVDVDGEVLGNAAEPVTFDRRKASSAMRDRAEQHGWEQKHGDCAAIQKDLKSGKSATVADKRSAVLESCERFETGTDSWTVKGRVVRELTPEEKRALLDKLAAELGVTVG